MVFRPRSGSLPGSPAPAGWKHHPRRKPTRHKLPPQPPRAARVLFPNHAAFAVK